LNGSIRSSISGIKTTASSGEAVMTTPEAPEVRETLAADRQMVVDGDAPCVSHRYDLASHLDVVASAWIATGMVAST